MPARHVVVDGSNMATEGSSLPSLKQLDEAVREYLIEYPDDIVTVVVDATFGHRIPPEERNRFEEAESAGEIVSPPAGAIGRGDAFLLRVADKVGAVVLSNDSFQEFHGEYEWLFDKGRLIGGKPVPGVGWIFTPRTPVRGPKSRESVKEAKRKRHAEKMEEPSESGLDMAAERSRGHGGDRKLQRAIAAAVEEAVEPAKGGRKRRRRRRGGEVPSEPLNEPFNFITFIATHQLGDEVEGTVEEFSSHGAFISVDGARCYLPLSAMGEVPPRSAREVLRKGERRTFVVQAFDAMRRGIELALPGFAHPAGTPTAETIDAEIHRTEGTEEALSGELPLEMPGAAVGRSTRAQAGTKAVAHADGSKPARKPRLEQEAVAKAGPRPARLATKQGVPAAKLAGSTKAPTEAKAPSQKVPAAKGATAKRARVAPKKAAGSGVGRTPETARTAGKERSASAKEPVKKQPATKGPAKKQPAKKEAAKKQPIAKQPAKAQVAKTVASAAGAKKLTAAKEPRAAKSGTVKSSRAKSPAAKASAPEAPSAAKTTVAKRGAAGAPATQKGSQGARTATAKKSGASGGASSKMAPAARSPAPKAAAQKPAGPES
jgi:hypothetical protein